MTSADARSQAIERAAKILKQAEDTRSVCPPVREMFADKDVDAAYAVQQINIEKRLQTGLRLVGRKIGITSKAVQEQVGVDQPDYGVLLSDMVVDDGGVMPAHRLIQPRAEAEVGIILGSDLDMPSPNVADVLTAIAYVVPSIEIVDSRIENWDISIVDTIADNASCGMFTLGSPAIRPAGFDFPNCRMELLVNGELVSSGEGRACLGSPLNGAAWLARQMQELGTPLRAGEIILTGALGPLAPFTIGDTVEARIEGLGSAGFRYGDA